MKYLLLFALFFIFIATKENLRGKEIEGYVEVPQGSSSQSNGPIINWIKKFIISFKPSEEEEKEKPKEPTVIGMYKEPF